MLLFCKQSIGNFSVRRQTGSLIFAPKVSRYYGTGIKLALNRSEDRIKTRDYSERKMTVTDFSELYYLLIDIVFLL